jgi:hypothetical protein
MVHTTHPTRAPRKSQFTLNPGLHPRRERTLIARVVVMPACTRVVDDIAEPAGAPLEPAELS